jgi:L-lactate dehydrogenase (cytochrome)
VRDALQSRGQRPRSKLGRAACIDDLRKLAHRRLPSAVYDYMEGAAEDEVTAAANKDAFRDYELIPRVLRDASKIDLATTIAGIPVDSPIVCAPTGFSRMFHPDGELAVAQSAADAGCIYSLSTMATRTIEEVAAVAADAPKWFQLYVWRDEKLVNGLIDRAKAAGYRALILTVDTAILGRRERDVRSGLTIPPKAGLRTIIDGARRPAWWLSYLTADELLMANVISHAPEGTGSSGLAELTNKQFDPAINWDQAERVAKRWDGVFAVKGVQCAADAEIAVDVGANVVIVSNHGGRQLDHAPAALRALPEVVAAVGDRAEVLLDGGVRRGTDVIKALALGANGVMIGRAYLYGLAAAGKPGVDRALKMLHTELRSAMALLGTSTVADINHTYIRRR